MSVVDLHERRAVKEGQTIQEDYDPNHGGRDEEERVPAEPQVVQGHLLPKIVPGSSRQDRKRICCNVEKLIFLFPSVLTTVGQWLCYI